MPRFIPRNSREYPKTFLRIYVYQKRVRSTAAWAPKQLYSLPPL